MIIRDRSPHQTPNGSRDLFPAETADRIERQNSNLLAGNQESEVVIRTVSTPNNGQRKVVVRRIRITGQAGESHMLLNMIEDRTDQAAAADVAAQSYVLMRFLYAIREPPRIESEGMLRSHAGDDREPVAQK